MTTPHRLGAWGEETARVFLARCGYRCLDRRYRRPGGELDLVVRRGPVLVFVEVKTRGPRAIDDPVSALHPGQLARLRRLAVRWLAEHPQVYAAELRFDLVAVTSPGPGIGGAVLHLVGIG